MALRRATRVADQAEAEAKAQGEDQARARRRNRQSRPAKPAPAGRSRPANGRTGPVSGFVLRSSEVAEGGMLPKEFTGDGSSATLPLQWSGAPAGTRSFALIMHHEAPDGIKWYWVLYNIPADVTSLPKNVKGIGTLGNNSVNRDLGYAPPHSKGPGPKKYTLTVYALSAAPQITVPAEQVSRDVLLAAMKDLILATAELNVIYSRRASCGGRPSSARIKMVRRLRKPPLAPVLRGERPGMRGRSRPENPPPTSALRREEAAKASGSAGATGRHRTVTRAKARVKAILSKYDESYLTAADAKAINEAFREAGLQNGPALQCSKIVADLR